MEKKAHCELGKIKAAKNIYNLYNRKFTSALFGAGTPNTP